MCFRTLGLRRPAISSMVGALLILAFTSHVSYLTFVSFDYGYNMAANATIGTYYEYSCVFTLHGYTVISWWRASSCQNALNVVVIGFFLLFGKGNEWIWIYLTLFLKLVFILKSMFLGFLLCKWFISIHYSKSKQGIGISQSTAKYEGLTLESNVWFSQSSQIIMNKIKSWPILLISCFIQKNITLLD